MSREFRMQEFHPYLQMHELQPAAPPLPPQQYPYPIQLPHSMNNTNAPPTYGMTAASAGSACVESSLPSAPLLHPLDPRKRKSSHHFGDYDMSDAQYSGSEQSVAASATRKRKTSSFGTASLYNDDCCDDSRSSRSCTTIPDKKQNHSEIEKRRRDKMNSYITELSAMIPMCGAMARKLDKLTVLRMAVQHLRTVRGSLSACPLSARPRPAFVSERELNALILQAAGDSFLIVVDCDRGRLLYVSHSVSNMLQYEQSELLGQSMFDILHPKDVAKVKEQLSSSDLSPRERLIDAKKGYCRLSVRRDVALVKYMVRVLRGELHQPTVLEVPNSMLPVKSDVVAGAQRLCPGARRSFFCRIKCKQPPVLADPVPTSPVPVKEEVDRDNTKHRKKNEKKYCVVQCTGYLKSWVPADMEKGSPETDEEQCTMSCLVATGRALPALSPPAPEPAPPTRRLHYVSRHAIDGKFLFVDQRVTLALGFLPQELLGTSLYEYVSGPELGAVARAHKEALMRRDPLHTPPYSFRKKDGTLATIQTHFKPFRNPWTKDVECLVANNTIMSEMHSDDAAQQYEAFKQTDEWREYLTGIKGAVKQDRGDGSAPERAGAGGLPSVSLDADLSRTGAELNRGRSDGDAEVQRLISSQVESHKIGSAIAEEAFRRTPSLAEFSPVPALLLQDPVFNVSLVDNILGAEPNVNSIRNNVTLSAAAAERRSPGAELSPAASPPLPPLDGNGEAAMAVIMSLLEADAGLGGPVNFSGLPWPLP